MNLITITGNLGADAQVVTFNSGDVASFRVAVRERVKNPDDTWGDKTVWFSCNYSSTSLIPFLTKGTSVLVQGRPHAAVGNDGKAYINIRVSSVEIIGRSRTAVASNG